MKKALSIILVLIMTISASAVTAFAEIKPVEMTEDMIIMDLINLNGGTDQVRKGSTVYYPISISSETRIADFREGTDKTYHNYSELVSRKTGIADGKTVITSHVVYDADTLKYEGVLPSEELYLKGGSVSTAAHGAETSAEILDSLNFTNARCFDIEVTVQNFADIEENMVLFNFKFTVLQENFFYLEEGNGKYYPNKVLSWKNNLSFDVFGGDGATENLNNLLSSEDLIFEIASADYSVLTEKYKDYTPYDTSTLNSGMVFFGGQNHYRKDNTVYYPYKNHFDFSSVRNRYGNVKIRFNLMLEYDADILEFDSLLTEKALSDLGTDITIIKQGTGRTPSDFENCGYVSFTFEMNSSDALADKTLLFTPKFNVLKEAFVNSFGMPKLVQYVTGAVYVINNGNTVPEAVAFSLDDDEATIGEGFTYEDLLKEFAGYTPPDYKASSIESVEYEPSFSPENDYTFKVKGKASKIAFLFINKSTATFTRDMAYIESLDGGCELWTIHRRLPVNEEIKVRAKFGKTWEDNYKTFTVELKKKDVSSIESVTWNGRAVSKNDYFIKVSGQPDKIVFVNPNDSTATYTRKMAAIKCYDANGNEVSPDSSDVSYEIWTINRSMKMNVEMRAAAKFGSVWETEMFSFVVG